MLVAGHSPLAPHQSETCAPRHVQCVWCWLGGGRRSPIFKAVCVWLGVVNIMGRAQHYRSVYSIFELLRMCQKMCQASAITGCRRSFPSSERTQNVRQKRMRLPNITRCVCFLYHSLNHKKKGTPANRSQNRRHAPSRSVWTKTPGARVRLTARRRSVRPSRVSWKR